MCLWSPIGGFALAPWSYIYIYIYTYIKYLTNTSTGNKITESILNIIEHSRNILASKIDLTENDVDNINTAVTNIKNPLPDAQSIINKTNDE